MFLKEAILTIAIKKNLSELFYFILLAKRHTTEAAKLFLQKKAKDDCFQETEIPWFINLQGYI